MFTAFCVCLLYMYSMSEGFACGFILTCTQYITAVFVLYLELFTTGPYLSGTVVDLECIVWHTIPPVCHKLLAAKIRSISMHCGQWCWCWAKFQWMSLVAVWGRVIWNCCQGWKSKGLTAAAGCVACGSLGVGWKEFVSIPPKTKATV